MRKFRLAGSLVGSVIMMTGQTFAQSSGDPDAAQVVALFARSCVVYTGNTAGLRGWISAQHLPRVLISQASVFLGPVGPGEVYGASNAYGKHVLISYDSGACQVVAMAGNPSTIRQTLFDLLHTQGFTVSSQSVKSKPELGSEQELFDAALGVRRWKISITSKSHVDAPNLAPEVHLVATLSSVDTH